MTIHILLQAEHLEQLLEPLGRHVRSFYGNQGGGSLPKDTAVAVCTIEKANSLVNKLLEDGRLSELGVIVIDELHMVSLSKAKVILRKSSLCFPIFFLLIPWLSYTICFSMEPGNSHFAIQICGGVEKTNVCNIYIVPLL